MAGLRDSERQVTGNRSQGRQKARAERGGVRTHQENMAKKTDDIKWTTIAWQGISMSAPEDWNIGAIGGEGDEGYLRIDSPDEPRMEIKWAKPSGNVDVKKIVDKYLSDIGRSRKRNAPEIEIKRDIKLSGKSRKRRSSVESFSWEAEAQGFGAARSEERRVGKECRL